MRAELASLTHCAGPFLSRASASLCWYCYTISLHEKIMLVTIYKILNSKYVLACRAIDLRPSKVDLANIAATKIIQMNNLKYTRAGNFRSSSMLSMLPGRRPLPGRDIYCTKDGCKAVASHLYHFPGKSENSGTIT